MTKKIKYNFWLRFNKKCLIFIIKSQANIVMKHNKLLLFCELKDVKNIILVVCLLYKVHTRDNLFCYC